MIPIVVGLAGLCAFMGWRWWINYCKYRACMWLLRRKFQRDGEFDRFCEQVKLELELGYPLPDREDDPAN